MPQTPDISTPKLAFVLMRASRSLAEFLEAGLAREGFQTPDFAILEVLLHKGPLVISTIEQKVHLATAPLRVAIDRLRRRGMVSGQSHRGRFHAARFELTEDGRKTITRIYARHTEDIEAVRKSSACHPAYRTARIANDLRQLPRPSPEPSHTPGSGRQWRVSATRR